MSDGIEIGTPLPVIGGKMDGKTHPFSHGNCFDAGEGVYKLLVYMHPTIEPGLRYVRHAFYVPENWTIDKAKEAYFARCDLVFRKEAFDHGPEIGAKFT